MDAFSEILSGVRLNGAVFFTAEFSAPWGFSAPASKQMADGQPLELNSGDVVIFPNGVAHHMSSKGAKRPFPNYGINDKIKARDLTPLHAAGGCETSRFICG